MQIFAFVAAAALTAGVLATPHSQSLYPRGNSHSSVQEVTVAKLNPLLSQTLERHGNASNYFSFLRNHTNLFFDFESNEISKTKRHIQALVRHHFASQREKESQYHLSFQSQNASQAEASYENFCKIRREGLEITLGRFSLSEEQRNHSKTVFNESLAEDRLIFDIWRKTRVHSYAASISIETGHRSARKQAQEVSDYLNHVIAGERARAIQHITRLQAMESSDGHHVLAAIEQSDYLQQQVTHWCEHVSEQWEHSVAAWIVTDRAARDSAEFEARDTVIKAVHAFLDAHERVQSRKQRFEAAVVTFTSFENALWKNVATFFEAIAGKLRSEEKSAQEELLKRMDKLDHGSRFQYPSEVDVKAENLEVEPMW